MGVDAVWFDLTSITDTSTDTSIVGTATFSLGTLTPTITQNLFEATTRVQFTVPQLGYYSVVVYGEPVFTGYEGPGTIIEVDSGDNVTIGAFNNGDTTGTVGDDWLGYSSFYTNSLNVSFTVSAVVVPLYAGLVFKVRPIPFW
jgi:hypothetical protein